MPHKVDKSKLHPTDLRNPTSFPPYNDCPVEYDVDIDPDFYGDSEDSSIEPSGHWCFLAEVVEDLTLYLPRIVLGVRDKNSKYLRVAFYFDNKVEFDYSRVHVGNVIAVLYARQHYFRDGSHGLRIEEPSHVKECAIHLCDRTCKKKL